MRSPYAAVIDLHEPIVSSARAMIESALGVARGVDEVRLAPGRNRIMIWFDAELIGLAEIVRLIERLGSHVRAVAQQRMYALATG